ncbi:MAG TPA: hypothetical protein VJX70_04695 [Candidatus Acidoferrum sp.]|nr:hypothetical protein [Candidatus Acidoferrum sp.]
MVSSLPTHYKEFIAPFAVVVAVSVVVDAYLFRFYRNQRRSSGGADNMSGGGWLFSMESIGGFSYGRLALASVFGLFLELLMIRWVSSEIRMFAYFKNFVLIACFLGFGLGCYLSKRRINILTTLLPLLTIVCLIKAPWTPLRILIGRLPSYLGVFSESNFWSVPSEPFNLLSLSGLCAAMTVVVLLFTLIAFIFIPVGQMIGWYLENAKRGISSYSVNILGSLAGILLYTLLCFLYQPPGIWLAFAGLLMVALLWKVPRIRYLSAATLIVCVTLASLSSGGKGTVYWSPYQKLAIAPVYDGNELISYELSTNDDWYQQIFNLSPAFVEQHPKIFKAESIEWNAYNLPYHFYPHPESVLILGAGTGNDVAAAVRSGADHVVAVEIDPLILKLGRKYHFEKPYDSPHVTPVLDDARSYIQNSSEQFDLIVFSLLDSHTTTSHFTNIRIDNYVYTLEALTAAKQRLRPGGILIVKFWVASPWIAGRLYNLLDKVFDAPPIEVQAERPFYATSGTFFVSGSGTRIAQSIADPALATYLHEHGGVPMQDATLTTDDWPYFYQRNRGLSATVILISIALIILCWVFLREVGTASQSFNWHFFFLGAGFLLLEAQIVSKMALLFGTTWAVNAIVIGSLMLIIVASNLLVQAFPSIPSSAGYLGIFLSIALSYLIPLEKFFFRSFALKLIAASLVLCLPVFFAGIVFIRSFALAGFRSNTLGSNLLGALVGGLLESLSYWTGLRALLILAACLYLLSWVALRTVEPNKQLVPDVQQA